MLFVGIALLGIAVLLIFLRKRSQDQLLEIKFTKTSTAKELLDMQQSIYQELGDGGFKQLSEVKGKVVCETPITSELAGQECVHYAMRVEERYEERYTETDSQGRTQNRTRTGDTTVASNTQSVPFYVQDATGKMLIDPEGASIEGIKAVERYEPYSATMGELRIGGFSFTMGGLRSGNRRILGYRFSEYLLPLQRDVYVIGEAADSGGRFSIRRPEEKGKPFIVTVKSEEELTRSKEQGVLWMLIGAIASAAIGLGLIVASFM